MGSLIPGYQYDIFISYRQKDNKGDRWVSEFVEALRTELESTFKEDISLYFDINPHDGLLETHDVDASLKDKLKCLVFLPIISRTYCDPKSFAWEHEFKIFIEQASKDQFGLKVKLPNGNVASRILPIQIHDLYPEDKSILENELGGVLRAIEFIYKEPGINKPLTSDDNEKNNLNKTKYRLQVNKVANAIDEIIHCLKRKEPAAPERKVTADKPVVKVTEDSKDVSVQSKPLHKYMKWLIVSILLITCIVGVNLIYKGLKQKYLIQQPSSLEKSIAVLPFVNDSPDKENEFFCNGMMDEILNNLQKIKDFRVLSRTSTEQYRGTSKPTIPEIAKALDVDYIVEGSVQKYGNTFRLLVQLIAANNEKHLWGESFEQEIKESKDIFKIQSQIAQSIAAELHATITPDEKQLIEKSSTGNIIAYDFFQMGEEELRKYRREHNQQMLDRAEKMYRKAFEYDSTFAKAYCGLANIFLIKESWKSESYYTENYLDSVLFLANYALAFDNHLPDAYYLRARYFVMNGKPQIAKDEYERAIKYNPNYPEAYFGIGYYVYLYDKNNLDFVKAFDYMNRSLSIDHGQNRPSALRTLGDAYARSGGFYNKARSYYQEALTLDGDTITYLMNLAVMEIGFGNYKKASELLIKVLAKDSTSFEAKLWLGYDYMWLGKNKEALTCLEYCKSFVPVNNIYSGSMHRLGYIYWKNGYKKEAEHWFNEQKRFSEESIKRGRFYSSNDYAYYDLAGVYAFMGDKEKAYENLRKFADAQVFRLWIVTIFKDDPLFKNMRDEPEFKKILNDVISKYETERERVRKWIEEQEKL